MQHNVYLDIICTFSTQIAFTTFLQTFHFLLCCTMKYKVLQLGKLTVPVCKLAPRLLLVGHFFLCYSCLFEILSSNNHHKKWEVETCKMQTAHFLKIFRMQKWKILQLAYLPLGRGHCSMQTGIKDNPSRRARPTAAFSVLQ